MVPLSPSYNNFVCNCNLVILTVLWKTKSSSQVKSSSLNYLQKNGSPNLLSQLWVMAIFELYDYHKTEMQPIFFYLIKEGFCEFKKKLRKSVLYNDAIYTLKKTKNFREKRWYFIFSVKIQPLMLPRYIKMISDEDGIIWRRSVVDDVSSKQLKLSQKIVCQSVDKLLSVAIFVRVHLIYQ